MLIQFFCWFFFWCKCKVAFRWTVGVPSHFCGNNLENVLYENMHNIPLISYPFWFVAILSSCRYGTIYYVTL